MPKRLDIALVLVDYFYPDGVAIDLLEVDVGRQNMEIEDDNQEIKVDFDNDKVPDRECTDGLFEKGEYGIMMASGV